MQFITRQRRLDVVLAENLAVAVLVAVQPIAVVRHEQLLFAQQLPVVAIHRTAEAVELVVGQQPVGGQRGIVVADMGRPSQAALAGIELPGARVLLLRVQRLVQQQDRARQPFRPRDHQRGKHQPVIEIVRRGALLRVVEQHVFAKLHGIDDAGGGDRKLVVPAPQCDTAITGSMIPDHLTTVLRNRKGDAGGGVVQRFSIFRQLGAQGIGPRSRVHPARCGGGASTRIDRHGVVLKLLEHRLLPFAEPVLVLPEILGRDREQGLLVCKGIAVARAGAGEAGRRAQQSAIPGRNRALGVAGDFRTQRSQNAAQFRGLRIGNRRVGRYGQCDRGHGARGNQQDRQAMA